MSAYSPCINYSDSKFFKRLLKWFQNPACLFGTWKNRYSFKQKQNLLERSPCCRERHGFCLPCDERKAAGFRSRLSTPPGINQAIPPKLMSPKRLIGLGLFRVLLIGSYRHRGLYLIGSGTAVGRVKDWDLSAALKSNLISESPSMSLLCLSLNFLICFSCLWGEGNVMNWISANFPRQSTVLHTVSSHAAILTSSLIKSLGTIEIGTVEGVLLN